MVGKAPVRGSALAAIVLSKGWQKLHVPASFAPLVCFGRKPKKIAVGQSVCYAPQQFRAPILRRNRWHFAARVVQTWVELRSALSAARLKGLLQQRQQEEGPWQRQLRGSKRT